MSRPDGHSRKILEVWQRHTYAEFVTKDIEAALATMTEDAHVLCVPSAVGAVGRSAIRAFYAGTFVPQIPPDLVPTTISQTIDGGRIVEESVYRFTHTIAMEWMLPGVPPTGKVVEMAVVGIIAFRDGLIASEHIHWDQGSVLAQLGLLQVGQLPIPGAASARKVLELASLTTA